ncbi:hypothetical protein [Dokdonia sp. Dokd-P16]|uniref:hypothetical protein n=1 Tax=Dokdonia sp. Dokd-P16 TaxID=2173169 RepID=UPI0013A5A1C5|nr:hypothetical protein [Dokdonia sp. Dokd-P16]
MSNQQASSANHSKALFRAHLLVFTRLFTPLTTPNRLKNALFSTINLTPKRQFTLLDDTITVQK